MRQHPKCPRKLSKRLADDLAVCILDALANHNGDLVDATYRNFVWEWDITIPSVHSSIAEDVKAAMVAINAYSGGDKRVLM